MTSIAFTRNYRDHGNDTGFQFEFFCDKCGNGFRSSFQASALGVGAKIAKGLGSCSAEICGQPVTPPIT